MKRKKERKTKSSSSSSSSEIYHYHSVNVIDNDVSKICAFYGAQYLNKLNEVFKNKNRLKYRNLRNFQVLLMEVQYMKKKKKKKMFKR